MAQRQPYPPQMPPMPFWRGVSDLSGATGDLLFGTYDRNLTRNVLVKNGASVRSRGGLERAYDSRNAGPSHTAAARFGANRVVLTIDAAGVRAMGEIIASTYSGYTIEHPGFPADEFDRAVSGALFTVGKPWIEGKDSDEKVSRTADPHFAINSGEDLIHASATGLQAAADWTIDAPTPFYTTRVDLDLTNLDDFGSNGQFWEGKFIQSLPNEVIKSGVMTKEAQWAVDAHSTFVNARAGITIDTCWSGLCFVLRVEKTGSSQWKLTMTLGEFVSSEPPLSQNARTGGFEEHFKREATIQTDTDIFTNWAFEFGRETVGNGKWKGRADLWRNKTVAQLEGGSTGNKFFTNTVSPVIEFGKRPVGRPSEYWSLPDNGGRFALYSKHSASYSKQIDIPRIKSSLGFLT